MTSVPHKVTIHHPHAKPRWNTISDSSGHPDNTSSPTFTPSETPPNPPLLTGKEGLQDLTKSTAMDELKAEASNNTNNGQSTAIDDAAVPTEPKKQDSTDGKKKKGTCHKHCKGSKKYSKKASKPRKDVSSSDSSISDSSSSSSDSEESTESDSSSEEDEDAKKKRRSKAKKAKKLKEKKKAKSKKSNAITEEESDDETSDDSSSEEDKKRRKAKSKKKRRAKKSRKEAQTSEEEEELDDPLAQARAHYSALRIGRSGLRRSRVGRAALDDRDLKKALKTKSKGKKAKRYAEMRSCSGKRILAIPYLLIYGRGSKVDFVRVDQLWDSSIHNYKLTETAEDANADEFDQFVFTVRRKFDWENKYTDTVIDIKSKPLKEALTHVMGSVKGVSFAEDTPCMDPNMIFLYLEELRVYMKELKAEGKSDKKKKKVRKVASAKAAHLKVLIKYLDKDYAEIKKTLYPLLESNTITFDLLWALFKSNEIAYCPTYSNPDEPRAFKIEYATKVGR